MFYKKVTKYCKENNISIMAFEVKCGLANGIVSKWVNGNNPTLNTIVKISQATGVPIEYWVSKLDEKDSDSCAGVDNILVETFQEGVNERIAGFQKRGIWIGQDD